VVGAGESPYRANIYRVERVGVIERLAIGGGRVVLVASLNDGELVGLGYFLREAYAASTVNAPFSVQDYPRAQLHPFGLMYLFLLKARPLWAVFVGPDLEGAFARLVTDRAVQRVVNENELQYRLLGLAHSSRAAMGAYMQVRH
jgi:hypothetical protein